MKKFKIGRLMSNKEVNNAGWIIGAKIGQMLLALVVGIFSARMLGPSNYGLINYAYAYTVFFASFCSLGINSVIVKEFSDHPDEIGTALGTSIVLRLISSTFSVLLVTLIVSVADKDEKITIAVVIICMASSVFSTFNNIPQWFQANYHSKPSSVASLVAFSVASAYRIILLIKGKSVIWFAFAYSVEYCSEAVLLYLVYRRNNGPLFRFSLEKAKSILSKSYNYIFSGIMMAVYGQTDKVMLKHMVGEEEVGFYSVAYVLCLSWCFVLEAIIDSVYPTIVELHKEDYEKYNSKNRQLYAIIIYISVIGSVLITLFANFGVKLLYGEKYLGAVRPLRIITWYTAFVYFGAARNAWLVCEGKQKYLKTINLFAVFSNIVMNYFLIPKLGASGAALASLITQISSAFLVPALIPEMRPNVKLMLQAILLQGLKYNESSSG